MEEGQPVADTLTKMNKAFFFFFFSLPFFRSCFVGTSYCMLPVPIVIESLHIATACCHCMLPLHAAIVVALHGVIVCCHCLQTMCLAIACCHCLLPLHILTYTSRVLLLLYLNSRRLCSTSHPLVQLIQDQGVVNRVHRAGIAQPLVLKGNDMRR